jgi:hypothetical protein
MVLLKGDFLNMSHVAWKSAHKTISNNVTKKQDIIAYVGSRTITNSTTYSISPPTTKSTPIHILPSLFETKQPTSASKCRHRSSSPPAGLHPADSHPSSPLVALHPAGSHPPPCRRSPSSPLATIHLVSSHHPPCCHPFSLSVTDWGRLGATPLIPTEIQPLSSLPPLLHAIDQPTTVTHAKFASGYPCLALLRPKCIAM